MFWVSLVLGRSGSVRAGHTRAARVWSRLYQICSDASWERASFYNWPGWPELGQFAPKPAPRRRPPRHSFNSLVTSKALRLLRAEA